MSQWQQLFIMSGIVIFFAIAIPIVIRFIYGRGMALRIFMYVIPPMGALVIVGCLWMMFGLNWTTIVVIPVVGTTIAVIPLVGLYRATVQNLDRQIKELQSATGQLATTASQSSSTAAEQSAMVAQVTVTIDEITQTSQASADMAQKVLRVTNDAVAQGNRGIEAIVETQSVMEKVREVNTLVDVVNGLAEQSNLLALNASIEAAKAGEFGRGFSVVASEVRNLANQSREATVRIRDAISRADQGTAALQRIEDLFGVLGEVLEEASSKAKQIAGASQQQSSGIQQINQAMMAVSQGAQEAALGARQIDQTSQLLDNISRQLRGFVSG